MIMDSPPSPQVVGLEFVRQYYTVLNKAPDHLHRFYSQDSSFVHGGPDTATREERAVFGQVKIHEKIVELDFRDCHAKIRQVDSHATLGEGVVIQVSGELSNNGEPMRRFMQTFVLAPQSPKKYYVHNDIFRYQDEVFVDDDTIEDGVMDEEEDGTISDVTSQPIPVVNSVAAMNGDGPLMEDQAPVSVHQIPPQPVHSNAIDHQPAPAQMFAVDSVPAPPEAVLIETAGVEGFKDEDIMDNAGSGTEEGEDEIKAEDEAMPNSCDEKENKAIVDQSAEPQEKRTFAMLLRNNTSQNAGTVNQSTAPSAPQRAPAQTFPEPKEPGSNNIVNHGGTTGPIPPNAVTNGTHPRGDSRFQKTGYSRSSYPSAGPSSRPIRPPMERSTRYNNEDAGRPTERRERIPFPDNQQVFVGNLPPSVTDDQLKECFLDYGNVVDVRIHWSNGLNRNGSADRPCPNYGFVVFDKPESVTNLLTKISEDQDQVCYKGHRLNVEEKKAKSGPPYTGRPSFIGDYRYSDGIPRGGGRGGRGGMGGERGRGRGSYRGSGGPTRVSPNSAGPGPGGPTSSGTAPRRP